MASHSDRWVIGRAYCPVCRIVRAYVKHADVEELRCPCGAVCEPASGDEAP